MSFALWFWIVGVDAPPVRIGTFKTSAACHRAGTAMVGADNGQRLRHLAVFACIDGGES